MPRQNPLPGCPTRPGTRQKTPRPESLPAWPGGGASRRPVPPRAAHSRRSAPQLRSAPNRRRAHIRLRAGRQPAKTRRVQVRPRERRTAVHAPWANLGKPGPQGQSVKSARSVSHARRRLRKRPPRHATSAGPSCQRSLADGQTCTVDAGASRSISRTAGPPSRGYRRLAGCPPPVSRRAPRYGRPDRATRSCAKGRLRRRRRPRRRRSAARAHAQSGCGPADAEACLATFVSDSAQTK